MKRAYNIQRPSGLTERFVAEPGGLDYRYLFSSVHRDAAQSGRVAFVNVVQQFAIGRLSRLKAALSGYLNRRASLSG